jgi:hypothetical protein
MRALMLGLTLLAIALVSASQATAAPSVRFGIQDDAWLQYGPGTLSSRAATLDRLGLDVVRVTVNWYEVERTPGSYTWRRTDALLNALNSRGLDPVVTLWGTPGWANEGQAPNRLPGQATDFANFARTIAARYAFVDHWVIWNEPNQRRWLDPVSPGRYVSKLLNPAYQAIKSVAPAAKIAGGVTAPRGNQGGMSPVSFLRLMDRAGARLDAYAHHPYPANPSETPLQRACNGCKTITMGTLERLVREVSRAFPRARIWLTEYGYQTSPDLLGLSLELQARYIGEAARRVYALPKVDMLIHYLYRDEPDLARWQSGLETVEGRVKPAMSATMLPFAQVSRRGSATRVWGQIRPGKGSQRYALQHLSDGRWVTLGGVRMTSTSGYLARRIAAPRGTKLRLWYSAARVASPVLVVR